MLMQSIYYLYNFLIIFCLIFLCKRRKLANFHLLKNKLGKTNSMYHKKRPTYLILQFFKEKYDVYFLLKFFGFDS